MKVLAAHKLAILIGAVLVGGVVLYLRRRSAGGSTGAAGSPYDSGVPVSPYSDSQAPQISFDFGSLLSPGNTQPGSGSSAPPPDAVPPPTTPPPTTDPGTTGGTTTAPRNLDSNIQAIIRASHATAPVVSLPIFTPSPLAPFAETSTPYVAPYVPRGGTFVAN